MPTTIGEFREMLVEAMDAVRHGKLDYEDANSMAKLAGQVTASLHAEANMRRQEKEVSPNGVALIGEMSIGERLPPSTPAKLSSK